MSSVPQDRVWVLDVPWEMRTEASWGGAEFNSDLKVWTWTGAKLSNRLRGFRCAPFSWERWLEDELNGWQTAAKGGQFVPRPHQIEASDAVHQSWVAGRPGFLVADDVGLGKTIAALEGVRRIGSGLKVLVLCPLSVVPHWRRSIEMFGTHTNRFCVLNYDRAKKLLAEPESAKKAARTRTKNKRHATQGVGLIDWDVVIADEAHSMRNPTSQRSAAVRQIIKGRGDTPAFVVWMSATAGQNPLELSYLAPLLAAATGQNTRNLDDFEAWCQQQGIKVKKGAYGRWEWVKNRADLDKMHDLLFTGTPVAGIRRRPTDISGWPEQQRVLHPIDLSAGEQALYWSAWTEFRAGLALQTKGRDTSNAMVNQLRFRQKASLLRVPHIAGFVSDLVDSGLQVAVSCEFLETVEALRETLTKKGVHGSVITGDLSPTEREQQRVAFQRGDSQVCLFTVTEGISLHAGETAVGGNSVPRVTVIADPRWSAIAMLQIEGRCHRDGQAAVAYIAHATGTVETKVVDVLVDRMTSTKTMVGDDTSGLEEIEAVLAHQTQFTT